MPSDSSLPDTRMYNPDPNTPSQDAGGKTKISPTSKEGASYQGTTGYGFMTNDASMKIEGGEVTGTTLPVAQPITPMMSGDPNHTAIDADDSGMYSSDLESKT